MAANEPTPSTPTTGVEAQEDPSPPVISNPETRPECFNSTLQEVLFVLTATMSIGTSSFLYGISAVITAPIARTLNMTSAQVTWISASSALTSGTFLLFFGKVADTFGRRPLLIFSMGAYAVSSLVAGFATNPMYMDIMLGLMGLWSASAVPPAVGILGAAYERPSRRKNFAFACFSAGNPLGGVMGTIFSGIAAHLFSWRASFYLMSIIYVSFFFAAMWTVPKIQAETEGFSIETMKRLDWLGILLSMAGIALFCSSLTLAGDAPNGWKTPYVLALLLLGIALIGAFIVWEGFCKFPMMPLQTWKDRNFSLINLVAAFGFLSFNTAAFWLSLYMQDILGYSPLAVAVRLLPQAIGGTIVNIIAGLILHRVNNRLLTGFAALCLFLSSLLLTVMKEGDPYWPYMFPAMILSVMGVDLEFNVAFMYVMSSLPPKQQSLAGSIFTTVTRLCSAIGLGISTSIYNAESTGTEALQTTPRPYKMAFLFCTVMAAMGLLIVPFLTIGTQGHSEKDSQEVSSGDASLKLDQEVDETPALSDREKVE